VQHDLNLEVRSPVDDRDLSELHARAFGSPLGRVQPWTSRLNRYSLSWVTASVEGRLVGFVNACWDGGLHAFLLDTVVDPDYQRRGIGRLLVTALITEVEAAGCAWLHVDYEPHLQSFYRDSCGFGATEAGLLRLSQLEPR